MDLVVDKFKNFGKNKKNVDNITKGLFIGAALGVGVGILNSIFSESSIKKYDKLTNVYRKKYQCLQHISNDDEIWEIMNTIFFYIKEEHIIQMLDDVIVLSDFIMSTIHEMKTKKHSIEKKVEYKMKETKVYELICDRILLIYEHVEKTVTKLSVFQDAIDNKTFTMEKNPNIFQYVKYCYKYEYNIIDTKQLFPALKMLQKWVDNKHKIFGFLYKN